MEGTSPRLTWLGRGVLVCAGLVCALLGGCNEAYNAAQRDLVAMHATGRYDAAAAMLDDPANRARFAEKSQLLVWLDRGAIGLAQGRPEVAIGELEKAESFMEVRRESGAGDDITRWLVNDASTTYIGEPYEEIYVNVLKLAARLEHGELDTSGGGGATVEARRMAGKADVLRDRYLRSLEAVNKKGTAEVRGWADATASTSDGQFIESPLGLMLSAVAFMKAGESELQGVAARRLMTAIDAQRGLIGPVRAEDFQGLGERRSDDVNVCFVAFSGRGPTKVARTFGPIPVYTYTIYYEIPELEGGSAEADSARVVFEDPALTPIELPLVEDMRQVAKANHQRQLPVIQARAILRSSLKAAAVAIGTEAARYGTRKKESAQAAVEIIGVIGGLLLVSQTEKADLRCWTFLPGQAHAGIAKVPPGEHRVRIEYLSGGRVLYSTPPRSVTVPAANAGMATVVGHYWR